MKNSRRLSLILILLGLFFSLGILFRTFLLDNLVRPVAVLLWVFLRILSSVDQAFYWGGLFFLALCYVCYSLFLRRLKRPAAFEQTPPSRTNATLENVRYWRTTILVTHDEIEKPNILKRNLGKMLAVMYASKQAGTSNLEIYNALKLRQIPLPGHVYTFLFPDETSDSGRTFSQTLQTFWQTPRSWIRKWTNRDVADYYISIEEVIALMESSMEINHDPKTIDASDH